MKMSVRVVDGVESSEAARLDLSLTSPGQLVSILHRISLTAEYINLLDHDGKNRHVGCT